MLRKVTIGVFFWIGLSAGLLGCDSNPGAGNGMDEPLEETEPAVLRAECEDARLLGTVDGTDYDSGFLIAAPHGTYDLFTAEIADAVCLSLRWNCVVARGYVIDGVRINVNRPTEGAGLSPASEPQTARSQCVFDYFVYEAKSMLRTASTQFYVEIHGASSIEDVEIATAGLTSDQTTRLKTIFQNAWNAVGTTPRTIKVEPNDVITLSATASKSIGMMSRLQPAIHIELPRAMRQNERNEVIQFLQNALFTFKLSD